MMGSPTDLHEAVKIFGQKRLFDEVKGLYDAEAGWTATVSGSMHFVIVFWKP